MTDTGPLAGITVVELAGIGPGPYCAMLLADMGASVVRVDRAGPASADYTPNPVLERGRRSIAVDLKQPRGRDVVLDLVATADVLVESFRPGVAERLGLGPDECLARNPRLVYGRMTGWGQDGPLAGAAGHDVNYISLTGALHAIGRAGERPVPPLNLVGDFGGGASSLAFGIVCALLESGRSGRGQVVDANVFDSTGTLMALIHGLRARGRWSARRGDNLLDTGCPYYDVYTCADGRWVAVGTIEERFFRTMLAVLGLDEDPRLAGSHKDRSRWPALREALTAAFATRTRDEWAEAFAGVDACVTPVLDLDEAAAHPHAVARSAYEPLDGSPHPQPAVAPRFSRSTTPVPSPAVSPGQQTREILAQCGYDGAAVDELLETGVVAEP
ncbi:CoA transferase [Blastococcus sp. CT_GayMR20]|uniref:CaiB/BaiF CoA transferase family protein n=1 Tax=Blastococcus sp. CT_GayMR20 TaxID=2559609 RepID=UPI001073F048|nr:CaiB/BaiF CoA-transferase family protein [Blastococcus sp. CT_GayMR20]TFV93780.1 CoA transferase [Blastococcus sp. CT_GayMR20]TFV93815.1 CoA transferase [Blastococcus sp. CT_GayMR20]